MNTTSLPRIFGVSALLAALVLPAASQADTSPILHKAPSAAAKTRPKLKTQPKQLSPLETMALAHKAHIAALARRAKALGKPQNADSDEGRESRDVKGVSNGEEYMRQLRAYPDNSVDPNAFGLAVRQRDSLPRAVIGTAGAAPRGLRAHAARPNPSSANNPPPNSIFPGAQWSFVGPINWYPTGQRSYYGFESMNGHLAGIAVDPLNNKIIYVASRTGGVFKSVDEGVKWQAMSNNWSYLRTNTVTIDPKNPLTVYAGTGQSPTGFGNAIGLMKTTDGGTTWTNIGANVDAAGKPIYFAGQNVTKVLIDQTNSNFITVTIGDIPFGAATPAGNIWNSTDGGLTWSSKVGPLPASGDRSNYTSRGTWDDAVLTRGGAYLAAGKGPDYGSAPNNDLLYRSTDQGQTWAQVANAPKPPADRTPTKGARLAASAVDPNTVYLIYAYSDRLSLFKSADNGMSWADITASSGINLAPPGRAGELSQVPYDYYLACSSRQVNGVPTDVLYAGFKSVFQQVQSPGNTVWSNVGNASVVDVSETHSDQQCITFDPANPDRGWIGNDGGIYQFYSNPATGVTTFLSLNDGLQTTQFYNTSFHPTDSHIMIGGTQDNGNAAALGDLNFWQMPIGGDGVYTAINPTDPLNMYIGTQNGGIYRTNDAFANITTISPDMSAAGTGPIAFVTPFVLDPNNPKRLYTAGQKLGRYDADTGRWTYFPTVLTPNRSPTLAVSPTDSNRIYVASDSGELSTTSDGGTTWVKLKFGNDTESLPNRNVGAILPDPTAPRGVYVGLSGTGLTAPNGHLYYCPDVSASPPVWNNVSGQDAATMLPDAPLNSIAIDPADSKILYVATDIGVFQTPDSGTTWTNATAPLGLPNVQVNDLKAMPLQGFLYAGTWGRGIYRIRIRNNDAVSGVLFSPEQVNGGGTITGTVLLGNTAAADTPVALTSSLPSAATVPASVTVLAGQSQASFTVTTSPVGFTTPVTITGSLGTGTGQTKSSKITVLAGVILPSLRNFAIDGGNFNLSIRGSDTSTATVTLSRVPTTPITVNLSSSNPAASAPTDGKGNTITSIVIAAGRTTGQFTITTNPIPAPETTVITATLGSLRRFVTIRRTSP